MSIENLVKITTIVSNEADIAAAHSGRTAVLGSHKPFPAGRAFVHGIGQADRWGSGRGAGTMRFAESISGGVSSRRVEVRRDPNLADKGCRKVPDCPGGLLPFRQTL